MKVEVTGELVSRTFGENTFYSQEAYMHREGQKYPEKMSLNVDGHESQYPRGWYLLDTEKSCVIGQYDLLTFSRYLVLTPIKS